MLGLSQDCPRHIGDILAYDFILFCFENALIKCDKNLFAPKRVIFSLINTAGCTQINQVKSLEISAPNS